MLVTCDPCDARRWTESTTSNRRVAIVPTMGSLHEGHLSLVRRACALADEVVVSIFVNPTQFAPHEDLARYPRPIEDDLAMLEREGVAMVYSPSNDAIYPPGYSTFVEPPAVAEPLEGKLRPGHFRGVCTIVLKLFQTIPATVAVFGQKDFQQALVVQAMVRDLDIPIHIDVAPTIREPDGLAMSSRNRYLSTEQRARSLCLSRALDACSQLAQENERSLASLESAMLDQLRPGQPDGADHVDYAVVVDRRTLHPVQQSISWQASDLVALIAARLGSTRLIDNRLLHSPPMTL